MLVVWCLSLMIAEYEEEFRVVGGYQIKIQSVVIVSCLAQTHLKVTSQAVLDPVYCAYF